MLAGVAGIIIIACVFIIFFTFGLFTYRRRSRVPLTPRSIFLRPSLPGVKPKIWDLYITPTDVTSLRWGDLFPISAQLVPCSNLPTALHTGTSVVQVNALIRMPSSGGITECALGAAQAQLTVPMTGQEG